MLTIGLLPIRIIAMLEVWFLLYDEQTALSANMVLFLHFFITKKIMMELLFYF